MDIINPATETLITVLEEDSPALIKRLYEEARAHQPGWAAIPLTERLDIIERFRDLLGQQATDLALSLSREMGKPVWQAKGEIQGTQARIDFFLEHSERWLADEWVHQETNLGEKIAWEPLGVIANISAWNYPFFVGSNVFIPGLIGGNAILYKPSEHSTLTGLKIEALLHEAGVPRQVFQVVSGGATAGETLLDLPLDGYFFTGSYRTGQHIYQRVAPRMVPCQLELGGKDPAYVNADNADLEAVARSLADGAFYNAGQSCCAVERIYVHRAVYQEFTEAFVEEVKNFKIGDPLEEDTYLGPLARKAQVDFLQKQVGDAVLKGARILCGEERWRGKGYFFIPTVLTETHHDMQLMREETFGPLIGIQEVRDDAEATYLMLDTPYGLTAGVFSDHYGSAEPVLKKMNTGSAYWNCSDRVSPRLPWSGRGHSGIGHTLSYLGIRSFVRPKAYHLRGDWER